MGTTMTRRSLIQMSAYISPAVAAPATENTAATELIESSHPRIVSLAKDITRSASSNRSAAIAIHDWVRDEVKFGISRGFYDTSATQVLDAGVGYCNTKVNLFNALLRTRGIATRIRLMDLSAQVLRGLFDPGTSYVDHAITEVHLDGRWVAVDSYIVDMPLIQSARRKLDASGAKAGFGIHRDGKSDWDGRKDNFMQCLDSGAIQDYVFKDHGLFSDVRDFYTRTPNTRNRKNIISDIAIRLTASSINRQIDAVRTASV